MTLNIFPVTKKVAKQLLFTAGILDFIIIDFTFTPTLKLQKTGLIYATFWGLATAFARITNGLSCDVSLTRVYLYLFACIYGLTHGLMPLSLYLILKKKTKDDIGLS